MKQLIDLYGKVLFKDNNHKEEFLNKYSTLSNCNVYKAIKNIEIWKLKNKRKLNYPVMNF